MTTAGGGPVQRGMLRELLGWTAVLALFGYAVFIHYGLGSAPGGLAYLWWHPRSFLLLSPTIGAFADQPPLGITVLSLPAALLAVLVFLGTRSALARMLGLGIAMMVPVLCSVGFSNPGLWETFHWRFNAVVASVCLILAAALLSPSLCASLLRLRLALRVVIYVPLAFGVVALVRNPTGTDETLLANISPWPAVSVIGLEVGAYTIVGLLLGVAIGLGALALRQRSTTLFALGLVAALVAPAIWVYARFSAGPMIVAVVVVTALVTGLASITRGGDRNERLMHRAALFALGAALVILPVFAGRSWANADYTVNKFVRAKVVNDALGKWFEAEKTYPDKLSQLVEAGYLEEIPRPRVGFTLFSQLGMTDPPKFMYRGLGSSYVLEFVSTEWVQCAYNPPWEPDGEYEDDDEYADEYGDGGGEAWSCPETRPELWGGGPEPAEGEDDWDYEDEEEE